MGRKNRTSKIAKTGLIVSASALVTWTALRVIAWITFDINCEQYLKRAADSNTVSTAERELSKAIDWMEKNNLTSGYTSVIYEGPADDVGFWYTNVVSARDELRALPESATALERTNVLMKLRETLCDTYEGKITVNTPEGISAFPRNALWASLFVALVSTILTSISLMARDQIDWTN